LIISAKITSVTKIATIINATVVKYNPVRGQTEIEEKKKIREKKGFSYACTIHPGRAKYDSRAEEVVPVNIRLPSTILVSRPAEQRIARAELEQYVNARSSSP